jgi:hypothetical protein
MDEADIVRIEAAVGCPLPGGYRTFLAKSSAEVARLAVAMPSRAVIWTRADLIIRGNQTGRGIGPPWETGAVVVGTNGGGDFWFVRRAGRGLLFWDHSSGEVTRGSFAEFLAELRRDARNPDAWQ